MKCERREGSIPWEHEHDFRESTVVSRSSSVAKVSSGVLSSPARFLRLGSVYPFFDISNVRKGAVPLFLWIMTLTFANDCFKRSHTQVFLPSDGFLVESYHCVVFVGIHGGLESFPIFVIICWGTIDPFPFFFFFFVP